MICDGTTWVPPNHMIAIYCISLRQLYFTYGIGGNNGNGLGGRNVATIYYRNGVGGNLRTITCSSESNVGGANRHSERVCWEEMINREGPIQPGNIVMVYTERFPCGFGPGSPNCFQFLRTNLSPETPVFWSFDYPSAFDQIIKNVIRKKPDDEEKEEAKKRRAQGTKNLNYYQRDVKHVISHRGQIPVIGEVVSGRLCAIIDSMLKSNQLPNPYPVADNY